MKNGPTTVDPRLVLLSGRPIRADWEAAPIGAYDIIRDDLRKFSTVQPVDRAYVERSEFGYRGVLYSHEIPHMFALNGNGFIAKPVQDGTEVLRYCATLEEAERRLTATIDGNRADQEQEDFNNEFAIGSTDEPSPTAEPEDADPSTLVMHGPEIDVIERVPNAYYHLMPQRSLEKELDAKRVCAGGVVMKDGKILLVKPRGGYGGYDWTFPKGFPAGVDGKHLEQTAVREVNEETGYRVFAKRYLGRFTHNDGGVCDYFECGVVGSKPKGKFDEFETEEIRWVTFVEALELLNDSVDIKILSHANEMLPKLLISKGSHSGTMIALHLPLKVAKKIAIDGGEASNAMHVTLAYLKGLSEKEKLTVVSVVRKFAGCINGGIELTLGGVGRFSASETSDGKDVIYLSVDSPQIARVRPRLIEYLEEAGLNISEIHGFVPHVTLAYVDKKDKTPIERFEPITVKVPDVGITNADKLISIPLKLSEQNRKYMEIGRRNYKAIMKFKKALPTGAEPPKKVGVKPGKASSQKMGAGGQVRYSYPQEKGGGKSKPNQQTQPGGDPSQPQMEQQQVLPHPDVPPPQPDQTPIAAQHPEKPPVDDKRSPDPTQPQQPKHTLNVSEFCTAVGVDRKTLMQIVKRLHDRQKFSGFMMVHLKEFVQEHGLDGDFFGLLYDVLTGVVPEGSPAAQQQQQGTVAKKPKPVG